MSADFLIQQLIHSIGMVTTEEMVKVQFIYTHVWNVYDTKGIVKEYKGK